MKDNASNQAENKKSAANTFAIAGIIIFVITCIITIPQINTANDKYGIYKALLSSYDIGLSDMSDSEAQEYRDEIDKAESTKLICYITLGITGIILILCIVGGRIVQLSSPPITINNTKSVGEQIKELAQLKDEGILTEEEFTTKKKELLDKI